MFHTCLERKRIIHLSNRFVIGGLILFRNGYKKQDHYSIRVVFYVTLKLILRGSDLAKSTKHRRNNSARETDDTLLTYKLIPLN